MYDLRLSSRQIPENGPDRLPAGPEQFKMGRTIIEKLWDAHSVADLGDGSHLIYIDRVMFHERTGSIALQGLAAAESNIATPKREPRPRQR